VIDPLKMEAEQNKPASFSNSRLDALVFLWWSFAWDYMSWMVALIPIGRAMALSGKST
jgi:hypothetical protein